MSKPIPSIRGLVLALVLIVLSLSNSRAQRIDTYTITNFTSPAYSTIVGAKGTNTIYQLASNTTQYYLSPLSTFSLPFAFKYDNVSYPAGTTMYMNFGLVSFTNFSNIYYSIINSSSPYPVASASTYPNAIAPLTGLQVAYNSGANYPSSNNGGVYYQVTGSPGSQVLTIEWNKFGCYSTASCGVCSYQVKMYEGTNMIEFIYEKFNQTFQYSTYYQNIGLNGSTSPSFVQVAINSSSTNYNTPANNIRFSSLPNVQMSTNPKSLNFGSQFTGLNTDYYVRVTHTGSEGTLNIQSASISGVNAADFKILSPLVPPQNIPIGGYVDYMIRFSPVGANNRNASFTIVSNGRDSGTQTVPLVGFGIAPSVEYSTNILFKGLSGRRDLRDSAEQVIVVRSTGIASLYTDPIIPYVFTGDGAPDYSISHAVKNPIAGGGDYDTLKIKFKPTVEGGRTAVLTINTNAANLPVYTINLKGVGLLPHIATSTNFMKFDSSVAAGSTVCQTLKIYNPGSDSLRISQQYFASNDGDFTMDMLQGQAAVIPGQDSTSIQVCFTPKQIGTRQARIRFATNIPKTFQQPPQDTSFIDIEIRGNGVYYGAFQTVTSESDSALIAVQYCHTDTIWNTGMAGITVNSVSLSGADAALYSLNTPPVPFTIGPGSYATYGICITPPDLLSYNAQAMFVGTTNGKPISTTVSYTITGVKVKNTIAPKLLFSGDDLVIGESKTADITVSNEGSREVTYTASVIKGSDYYSIDGSGQLVVAPGTQGTFTVRFAPTTEGAKSGTVLVLPAGDKSVAVALAGSAHKQDQLSGVRSSNSQNGFTLAQNVPNPALGMTSIAFALPKSAHVRISLLDMTGKEIKEIASGTFSEGSHSASLSTQNIASGTYIYVLESEGVRLTQSMVITK